MGSQAPTIEQLSAWYEAREELPKLAAAAALEVIRCTTRSVWLREAIEAGNASAKIVGLFTMPTDTDRRWPVLVLRVTRGKTPQNRKRVEVVLVTKTQPARWTVIERKTVPKDLEAVTL